MASIFWKIQQARPMVTLPTQGTFRVLTVIHTDNRVPEVRIGYTCSLVVDAFARYRPTIGYFNALLIPAVPQDTARKKTNKAKQPVLRRRPTSSADRILQVEHQPIVGVYVLSIVSGVGDYADEGDFRPIPARPHLHCYSCTLLRRQA